MAGRGVPRVVRCRQGADLQGGRAGRLCCAALIAMMKATDFRDRDDRPVGCSRDRSVIGRVLLKAKVRSAPMIVPAVGREDAPEAQPATVCSESECAVLVTTPPCARGGRTCLPTWWKSRVPQTTDAQERSSVAAGSRGGNRERDFRSRHRRAPAAIRNCPVANRSMSPVVAMWAAEHAGLLLP
jgi:hypothetical protein